MLSAYGWAIVRSSRAAYENANIDEIDEVDKVVGRADMAVFVRLRAYLSQCEAPDLDWHFREYMNNDSGILTMSSSTNHRGAPPTSVGVLEWLAQNAPGSYGIVYLHDDEDFGERDGIDHANEFRVWRLLQGKLEELADPLLSPIVPNINPSEHG